MLATSKMNRITASKSRLNTRSSTDSGNHQATRYRCAPTQRRLRFDQYVGDLAQDHAQYLLVAALGHGEFEGPTRRSDRLGAARTLFSTACSMAARISSSRGSAPACTLPTNRGNPRAAVSALAGSSEPNTGRLRPWPRGGVRYRSSPGEEQLADERRRARGHVILAFADDCRVWIGRPMGAGTGPSP